MPVTAKFVADFSNFMTAAKSAEGALDKLASAAGVTERSVDKAAKAFSGENLIANAVKATEAVNAIGGASKLTEAEMARVNRTLTEALAKMQLMGVQAPADMVRLADATKQIPPALSAATTATTVLKGALSSLMVYLGPAAVLGGIVSLGKGAIDAGDALVKASDRTGIATEALQSLSYIAEQSGNSLDSITSAIGQMQNRLAEGDKSAVAAVNALHISMIDLLDLTPDQQFLAIARAIGEVSDPMRRTQLAMDLFGRSGAEILPTLRADIEGLADAAPRMSDAAVRGLDAFGDLISTVWLGLKNVVGTVLAYVFDGLSLMAKTFKNTFSAMNAALHGDFDAAIKIALDLGEVALPKVAQSSAVAASGLSTLSTETNRASKSSTQAALAEYEQAKFIRETTAAVTTHIKEVEKATKAKDAFRASVVNLTGVFVPLRAAIQDAGSALHDIPSESLTSYAINQTAARSEAEKWAHTNGAVLAPSIQAIGTSIAETGKSTSIFSGLFRDLPGIIIGALQGGGSSIKAAGAAIGTNLMTSFGEKFGPAIKDALPFGIGNAVVALLPSLGALFGPVAEKIAGFFRSIFGGPSQDELRGRQAVADFEKQLAGLLSQTQLNEAGNESWKKTVIAIRDAYIAAGLSEQEALADAERLWKSSKDGGTASQIVIDEINAKMKGLGVTTQTTTGLTDDGFGAVTKAANNAAMAAGSVVGVVDGLNRSLSGLDRDITTTITTRHLDIYERNTEDTDAGFAAGTMGRFGSWFANFGSGTPTTLHGNEAVVRADQAAAFAADMGGGNGAMAAEIAGLRSDLNALLPRAIGRAVRDAMQLSGAMA